MLLSAKEIASCVTHLKYFYVIYKLTKLRYTCHSSYVTQVEFFIRARYILPYFREGPISVIGPSLLQSLIAYPFLQASARQKPVSKRLAHFSLLTTLLSSLFCCLLMLSYAVLCYTMEASMRGRLFCGK